MDFETNVKIIILGNGGVGKSSMAARYCRGVFTSTYKKTIGVDFLEKKIESDDGQTVNFMVWDTAGQEEFDAVTRQYYAGAGACALVFSTIDRASFEAVAKWKTKVLDNCDCRIFAVVQNKIDLAEEAVVAPDEAEALARSVGAPLFRTSVKDDRGVNELFEYLASQVILAGDGAAAGAVSAMGEYAPPKSTTTTTTTAAAAAAATPSSSAAASTAPAAAATAAAPAAAAPAAAGVSAATAAPAPPAATVGAASAHAAAGTGADVAATGGSAAAAGAPAAASAPAPAAAPPTPPPVQLPASAGAFKLTAEPRSVTKKRGWC